MIIATRNRNHFLPMVLITTIYFFGKVTNQIYSVLVMDINARIKTYF